MTEPTEPTTAEPKDAETAQAVRRTRVRTRKTAADVPPVDQTAADAPADDVLGPAGDEADAGEDAPGATQHDEDEPSAEQLEEDSPAEEGDSPAATGVQGQLAEAADDEPSADNAAQEDTEAAPVRRRRARRRTTQRPLPTDSELGLDELEAGQEHQDAGRGVTPQADAEVPAEGAAEETADDDGQPRRSRRRRGRGRRGRGGRGGGGGGDAAVADVDADADDDVEIVDVDLDEDNGADGDDDAPAPTRLQARQKRAQSTRSGRRGRTSTGSQRGRKPYGGVSEETRRAINESPPRRMMVTVGEERTQIAVLEERTLVEHYVTRRSDVSYVGNIYLGRVQNVLPGMEAAFVDIGKGRNGVLYAGEVNYDEADLDEGDLPRIEQTLKQGQSVLVQVTKDPMGSKGARLTQHLSIAGRYCVLAPGDGMLGISRKLSDDERERLRRVLKSVKPDGYGLIVRTAAEGATAEQLQADVERLVRIWEQVQGALDDAKPLESVYTEPDLVIRVIRDIFGPEYTELIVDSAELAGEVRTYLERVSPELVDRVKVHEGDDQIFDAYEITNQIRRALEKKVWLKSGGYLIVEKTEAMWVIDVNTGKFVGERNLEETVLKNNIEAAVEIARQLRLRDMGGIIVIDFVDMLVPANRDEVLKRFKRELARDKTKSRVMEISKLGLVQMTRKNVSQGLQESFTAVCEVCEGRGRKIVETIV